MWHNYDYLAAKFNTLPQPPVAPIVDETSLFLYLACFLGILFLKEAVLYWVQSFKADKIDITLRNSEKIEESLERVEKILEKISDKLDRK